MASTGAILRWRPGAILPRVDLYEAMTTAGTIRAFLPDPVPMDALYRALDKARFAPSGGNRQGQRVIVVRDPGMRRTLCDLYLPVWRDYMAQRFGEGPKPRQLQVVDERFAARLDEIPVHLIVCVRMKALQITDLELDRPCIVGGASIYPFVQNLLLACRAEGLGAALTTLLITREPEVRELLGIAPEYGIAAHVLVGYPDPQHYGRHRYVRRLSRRTVEDFTTLERFDGQPLRAPAS